MANEMLVMFTHNIWTWFVCFHLLNSCGRTASSGVMISVLISSVVDRLVGSESG